MSDEDEGQLRLNSNISVDQENRRRLLEIKAELQRLIREKKKYDAEKLTQEIEFLQGEINDLTSLISEINREIKAQSATKTKLHIQITNLRSRSQLHYRNLAVALREKQRFEDELKKENKTEEYRELARKQIRNIVAALPILEEEDKYKERVKGADEAQLLAVNKRNKLAEQLNKFAWKHAETKKLSNEKNEKMPIIEKRIDELRLDLEKLKSSMNLLSTNGKKSRRRLSAKCNEMNNSINQSQPFISHEEDSIEQERQHVNDQLSQLNILINYFQEKMHEHGLALTPSPTKPDSQFESTSTIDDQKSILASYTNEQASNDVVAMKLPRNFTPFNFQSTTINDIIHSSGSTIEYKKELSDDILKKYGGQVKSKKSVSTHKKQRTQRKHFAILHRSQMISLYNNVRSLTESSDTLPSIPMYEYDLTPAIKALQSFKQSLECYHKELSDRQTHLAVENEHSAFNTISDVSPLFEQINISERSNNFVPTSNNVCDVVSSTPNSTQSKTNQSESVIDLSNDISLILSLPSRELISIDRQVSDEGYRSVRNEQLQQRQHSPISLKRSKSYDSIERTFQWAISSKPLSSSASLLFATTFHDRSGFQSIELFDESNDDF